MPVAERVHINDRLDPNQHRKEAAQKIEQAKAIQAELDSPDCDFTADQKDKRYDQMDRLMSEVDAHKQSALDIEAKEKAAEQRRAGKGAGAGSIDDTLSPIVGGRPYSNNIRAFGEDGEVRLLGHGESFAASQGPLEPAPALGDVVGAIITGNVGSRPEIAMTLGTGADPTGGYFIPGGVADDMIDLARSESVLSRAGMRVFNMNDGKETMLRVTGDPAVTWTAEGGTLATATPTFGRLNFRARKVGVIVPITSELVEDARNSQQVIEQLLTTAIAQEIDRAALLGDADGEEPVGIFNYSGVTENAIGGAVDWDDFLDSHAVIETANGMPGAIIYPPSVKKSLAQLKINSEANHYAPAPQALDGVSRYATTKLASTQAVIGDFSQVIMGIRRGMTLSATSAANTPAGEGFSTDTLLVKITMRLDIQIARPQFIETLTGIS